jgi:hypothetical protein
MSDLPDLSQLYGEVSEEYLIHQARVFHEHAVKQITEHQPGAIVNLAFAVDYLIEAQEKQLKERRETLPGLLGTVQADDTGENHQT